MIARVLFLATLGVLLANRAALANEILLPGHALSTSEAAAKADTVFAGRLVSLDPADAPAPRGEFVGKVVYLARPGNGIHVPVATQNTTVRTPMIPSDLGIPVTMTVGAGEKEPKVGRTYLFYVKDDKRPGATGYAALKLSPAGSDAIPTGGSGRP